jgi:hypothetical protein
MVKLLRSKRIQLVLIALFDIVGTYIYILFWPMIDQPVIRGIDVRPYFDGLRIFSVLSILLLVVAVAFTQQSRKTKKAYNDHIYWLLVCLLGGMLSYQLWFSLPYKTTSTPVRSPYDIK